MNGNFIQIQDGKVIIDQMQLMTYGALVILAILVIIAVIIALKRRNRDFIKTMPTNLKDGE